MQQVKCKLSGLGDYSFLFLKRLTIIMYYVASEHVHTALIDINIMMLSENVHCTIK